MKRAVAAIVFLILEENSKVSLSEPVIGRGLVSCCLICQNNHLEFNAVSRSQKSALNLTTCSRCYYEIEQWMLADGFYVIKSQVFS